MKRGIALLLSLILLTSVLSACGKEKPTLTGDWYLSSVSLGESVETLSYDPNSSATPPLILIAADGSFILQNATGTVKGSWAAVEKSKTDYTFNFSDENATVRKCVWEKGEDSFSWEDDDGYLYVYTRIIADDGSASAPGDSESGSESNSDSESKADE